MQRLNLRSVFYEYAARKFHELFCFKSMRQEILPRLQAEDHPFCS